MRNIPILLILVMFTGDLSAQIKAGDKAPALHITSWIANVPKQRSLKGKMLVIDFWATWCAPCLASVPHMNGLVKANRQHGNLTFLSISDEKENKIQKLLPKVPFSSIVACDSSGQIFTDFGVRTIPFCVLVDEQMNVKWTGSANQLTQEIIDQFMQRKEIPVAAGKARARTGEDILYDSLVVAYRKIFEDTTVTEAFELGPLTLAQMGMRMINVVAGERYNDMQIGLPLRSLLSDLTGSSDNQLRLPVTLEKSYASICYKSRTKIHPQEVLDRVIRGLELRMSTRDTTMEVLTLEVTDTALLYAAASEPGKTMSRMSSGEDFINMDNHVLAVLNKSVQNRFNTAVVIKDVKRYDKRLTLTVQCKTFEEFQASMQSYGIKATRGPEQMKLYYFER